MGRPLDRQKVLFTEAVKEALEKSSKLKGARIRAVDASTLLVQLPSALGEGPCYSLVIRATLDGSA